MGTNAVACEWERPCNRPDCARCARRAAFQAHRATVHPNERGADQRRDSVRVTKDPRSARRPLLLEVEAPWPGWDWCERCDCYQPAEHRHWNIGGMLGVVAALFFWVLLGVALALLGRP